MKLSDLDLERFGITLLHDGNFDALGSFSRKRMGRLLVFINDSEYIPLLQDDSDRYLSVICTPDLQTSIPPHMGLGISDNPEISFYTLHNYLAKTVPSYKILPKTDISCNATIHKTAFIDTNVKISEGCVIHPNATVLRGTILEENVTIGPGCVIGGEGFRFFKVKNEVIPIIHVGGVILKKGVEIHANTCIDKAVYRDFTIIGEGTKVSNLVQIAHNVDIGERCMIASGTMVAGSTVIGNGVWIGPNASISDNLVIGNLASITLGAVVTKNVPDGMTVTGNFAIEHSKFIKFLKTIR